MLNVTLNLTKNLSEFNGLINNHQCRNWCLMQLAELRVSKLSLILLSLICFMLAMLIPLMRFKSLDNEKVRLCFYECLMVSGMVLEILFLIVNW